MYKAIILEDEVKSLLNLRTQLRQNCPDVEIVAEARNIEECKAILNDSSVGQIDIAFMDIDLPDGLAFQLLEDLENISFEIIFVTGHNEYAVRAFDFASIGYILKPIDPEKLINSVKKAKTNSPEEMGKRLEVFENVVKNPGAFDKLTISALDGMYFINLNEILRFEAEDNYTHVYKTNKEKITVCKTLKSYEKMLQGMNFYRVHKSHIVNLNYIDRYVKGDGGFLVMEDGKKIDVGRRRRASFLERLKLMHATV